MGFATHLGPWLQGTQKWTTGTTPGTIRNTGASTVSQTFKKDFTGAAFGSATTVPLFTLPAGAQIVNTHIDVLTAFTGSTAANITIGDGTTANKYWTTTDITAAGRVAMTNAALSAWCGAASTASPNGIGIGPLDITVTAALTPTVANVTAGLVQFTIVYVVAQSDGTQYPVAS